MNSFEQKFAKTRPFLWHLTAAENIDRIIEMNRLVCAATLLRDARRNEFIRAARKSCLTFCINGETVTVRDHHETLCKKVKLPPGWTCEKYIEYLNDFVFFFPGKKERPIKSSKRFFEKYCCNKNKPPQQALRIPTEELFMANPGTPPQFSDCNSGAILLYSHPRRGPDTFVCGEEFEGDPSSDVFEVAFRGRANLPDSLEVFKYDCRKERFFLITNRSQ